MKLVARLALALLSLNVLGAIAAVVLDLPAKLVLGNAQNPNLGVEVIWQGSAISAPWPPLLALVIGSALLTRRGRWRVLGLILLALTGLVMIIGVIGEFVEGAAFLGIDQLAFIVFSIGLGVLAAALATASIRAMILRLWQPT